MAESVDWVNCPVCGEPDMQKTGTDDEVLIHCTNHECASNGGSNSDALGMRSTNLFDQLREDHELLDWLEINKARVGWAYMDVWVVCDASQNTIAKHPDSLRQALKLAKKAHPMKDTRYGKG